MSADKCQHCGAKFMFNVEQIGRQYACGTVGAAAFQQSALCSERAARQKAEKALSEMTHDCEKYRARYKQEADNLAKERYEHDETRKKLASAEKLYQELLFGVARKFEGETRHQTALRYIRHAEDVACEGGKASCANRHEPKKGGAS